MSKTLMELIFEKIFDAEWVGRRGEKLTQRELNFVRLLGRNGKILKNIYIPKANGETTEIDIMFITQKGIFVIESKNYSGWIFGDEKSFQWTATLSNLQKNRFYNPIRQNANHIKWLKQYINEDIPMFSLIVFSERCELKKISVESPDVAVIKRDSLYAAVRRIWDEKPDVLDKQKCQDLYQKLKPLTNADSSVKDAHIKSIENKYTPKNKNIEIKTEDKNISSKKSAHIQKTVAEFPDAEIISEEASHVLDEIKNASDSISVLSDGVSVISEKAAAAISQAAKILEETADSSDAATYILNEMAKILEGKTSFSSQSPVTSEENSAVSEESEKSAAAPEESAPLPESSVTDESENNTTEAEKICPRCGAKLILRTAKKGKNIGNRFWGCSSFPKCRYTAAYSEETDSTETNL